MVVNEHDVLRPLAAGGPHPETSDALMLFGRLVGSWDLIADDGREFRWAFSEITADSFRWQAHISEDGGKTWRLVEEIEARRRTGRPA